MALTAQDVLEFAKGTRFDNDYTATHAKRFAATMAAVELRLPKGTRILDVGWPTVFTDLLIREGYGVQQAGWDIRNQWPHESGSLDCVFLMEVIEHLKDPDGSTFDEFLHAGLNSALAEAKRCLKEGGMLLITTPNIASYGSISRLLRGQNPMLFKPHVREYAPGEVEWWVHQAGLKVVEVSTQPCYEGVDSAMIGMLNSVGASKHLRDDTTFLWATK
jgi:SAM-dependent methyltransferase